ncbi:hypothetical protein B566_EDAN004225 [Ephemera danica]|nr:hypothetical protein B566_EDAN004225 [Ephemera danica]
MCYRLRAAGAELIDTKQQQNPYHTRQLTRSCRVPSRFTRRFYMGLPLGSFTHTSPQILPTLICSVAMRSAAEFEEAGRQHVKLLCEGKSVPNKAVVMK